MSKISCIIFTLFCLLSCKKNEDRACWKLRGKDAIKEYSLGDIESFRLGRNIRFVLIQDSTNKVVIKTGENLINFIQVSQENGELVIQNENTCNFLRYGKNDVLVELHFSSLRRIYFEGSEPLTNIGQLSMEFLYLTSNDNASEINLNLSVDSLYLHNPHAWPIIHLSGSSKFCQVNIQGDAHVNLKTFSVLNEFQFASESSQIGRINLHNTFKFIGQLRGNGDVFYSGQPTEMYKMEYGKGRFIED